MKMKKKKEIHTRQFEILFFLLLLLLLLLLRFRWWQARSNKKQQKKRNKTNSKWYFFLVCVLKQKRKTWIFHGNLVRATPRSSWMKWGINRRKKRIFLLLLFFFFRVFRFVFYSVCSPPMLKSVCKIIYVWQLCEVPCNLLAKFCDCVSFRIV